MQLSLSERGGEKGSEKASSPHRSDRLHRSSNAEDRDAAFQVACKDVKAHGPDVGEGDEAQLAHGKSGPLGAAYDRAEFMGNDGR